MLRFTKALSSKTRELSKSIHKVINVLSQSLHRESPKHSAEVQHSAEGQRSSSGKLQNFSTFYKSFQYTLFTSYKSSILHNKPQLIKFVSRPRFYGFFLFQTPKFNLNPTYPLLQILWKKFQQRTPLHSKPNLSLSARIHHQVLSLAKTESSSTSNAVANCHIDFPVNFTFSIPNETILTQDTLDEILFNIKTFEKKLNDFKADLTSIFELGELPIKYLSKQNVLRVYFANCDKERLSRLCNEKGIVGGFIHEDSQGIAPVPAVVNDSDILSSYSDDHSFSSDVLSSLSSDLDHHLSRTVVRPEIPEDFHWVDSRV
ncbi:hypothetical protein KGF56_002828 [Candida oxycetoniae]|uniref:Uncharacterized protein n=1 Tax=Candida oxycetoniae TaxID=497107 RepID=A0AAI9SWB8_9ASCO|nr:uncharacterized protein KGF56_002828 [Candida oxycetoniae]KAI3404308.2 hypothetical protein KGF56_002828 [Candida oxycetoniae]